MPSRMQFLLLLLICVRVCVCVRSSRIKFHRNYFYYVKMLAAFSMREERIPLRFTHGLYRIFEHIVTTLCDHTQKSEKKTDSKWFNKIHIICIKIDTVFRIYAFSMIFLWSLHHFVTIVVKRNIILSCTIAND